MRTRTIICLRAAHTAAPQKEKRGAPPKAAAAKQPLRKIEHKKCALNGLFSPFKAHFFIFNTVSLYNCYCVFTLQQPLLLKAQPLLKFRIFLILPFVSARPAPFRLFSGFYPEQKAKKAPQETRAFPDDHFHGNPQSAAGAGRGGRAPLAALRGPARYRRGLSTSGRRSPRR